MRCLFAAPTRVTAPGNEPKRIDDDVGRLGSIHSTAMATASSGAVAVVALPDLEWTFIGSPPVLALLLATAALGGQLSVSKAFILASPTRLGPIQYVAVALAALLDLLLFGHAPSTATAAGIVLIVGSAIWLLRHPGSGPEVTRHAGEPQSLGEAGRWLAQRELVQRAERLTSCEVRVHVDRRCEGTARPRRVFDELGMERTTLRNGVLVYLAPETGTVALVVDQGIAEVVPARQLRAVCQNMSAAREGFPLDAAVTAGIMEFLALLGRHFPWHEADVNELPDEVSVGSETW